MMLLFAFIAALLCAIMNSAAAVLEKSSESNQSIVTSRHSSPTQKLRASLPYLSGIALDIAAWVLTLYAVHILPLFVVQPIIATSVVVTLFIERHTTQHRVSSRQMLAALTVLAGLAILATTATPETTTAIARPIWWAVVTTPIVLAACAGAIITIRPRQTAQLLAALSGLAFGGVSVAGRALIVTTHWLGTSYNPLAWAIVAYGLVGITLFTIALQKSTATSVNAIMVAFETIIPIIVGFLFLGDHPAHNLWLVAALGLVSTLMGILLISRVSENGTRTTRS
jgi:drug/metabolite transporter (DMT)-like permease